MTVNVVAASGGSVGNPAANIGIFALFVAITLYIVIRASKKNTTAAEFFTAGRAFTGPQNGIAISGDYLSAASFLGIAGAIAVFGYDGFLYSIGFLVAWLVALLLVAALLLNVKSTSGQALVVAVVGLLMIFYVLVGGMRGTTWVQIVKAALLIVGAGMLTAWALGAFGLNFSAILGEATAHSSHGQAVLAPGLQYGK